MLVRWTLPSLAVAALVVATAATAEIGRAHV
jgi:hypothetical protein